MHPGVGTDIAVSREKAQKETGKNAAATASATAGSKLATRIFLPHTRFSPTQKMSTEPTSES